MTEPTYALSLKQPWAALLVHGRKTIEVRKWPTTRRGRIFIHAARIPDERPQAWRHVPPELEQLARQNGGIIGEADLKGCVIYRSVDAFCRDQSGHLNEREWFEEPYLYGFQFANAKPVAFRKYPGWMRFFPVEAVAPQFTRSKKS